MWGLAEEGFVVLVSEGERRVDNHGDEKKTFSLHLHLHLRLCSFLIVAVFMAAVFSISVSSHTFLE